MKTIFYTGHRPKDLGGGYLVKDQKFKYYREVAKQITLGLMDTYPVEELMSGGALGWDKMAFYAGVDIKEIYPNTQLSLALPCAEQPLAWVHGSVKLNLPDYPSVREMLEECLMPGDFGYETITEYYQMVDLADKVFYTDTIDGYLMPSIQEGKYHPAKLTIRNTFMKDYGDIGVALFDDTKIKGGTFDCVKKIKKDNKPLVVINPHSLLLNKTGNWQ